LLVFWPAFGVAPKVTYKKYARLEGEPKSGAILVDLFVSATLSKKGISSSTMKCLSLNN
jgi:hypothetical protein